MRNAVWLFVQFFKSNLYGFPFCRRWLGRVKGSVCNHFDRFPQEGFDRFLLIPYGGEHGKGVASAARLGKALEGVPGALCAAAGLLTPWLLGELVPDVALHWCPDRPFAGLVLTLTRAVFMAVAMVGVLDFRSFLTAPDELLFLAGGLADSIFGWAPGAAVLLLAAGYQLLRAQSKSGKKEKGVIIL